MEVKDGKISMKDNHEDEYFPSMKLDEVKEE